MADLPVHLYDQIAANKRNSILLMGAVFLLLAAVGYAFGFYSGDPIAGLLMASGFALLYLLVSYGTGDKIVLASMGAKAIAKADSPQLFNCVEEMSIAADPDEFDIANRGTQHLFIINPLRAAKDLKRQAAGKAVEEKSGWFDTHPPIGLHVRLLREMTHTESSSR